MKTDLLSGIAVLIRPLVNDQADQLFDSKLLADRLAEAYGVSIPPVALEGMTHRLVAANILRIEQLASGLTKALYNSPAAPAPYEPDAEPDFQDILDEFLKHAHERIKVANKQYSDEVLLTGFLRRLATLDFSAIKVKPQVDPKPAKTIIGPDAREQIALSQELAEQAALDSLVASFIASLKEHRPEQFGLLANVADGALAAELVFDLQAPTSVSKLTDTTVVVDTPLILSYLDLSSIQDTSDTRKLFEQIREAGAEIAAFQHSIEEAEGVLKAVQSARGAGDAYGPSVHRLANTTFRAYFESMIGSVGRRWSNEHGLKVIQKAATHYHKNFTEVDEEDLLGSIRLSAFDRVLTRERDAKSVAETMRRLGGAHIPINNVESCRFIFVTPNSALQRRVAGFLESKKFVGPGEFNPIVTSRYLAGLCWLICGGKSTESPSMAKLLANCAAALRLRPEIAERTKRFLAAIDPEKARHFEALMTNERASQYMTEATLGDISAVTANNVEDIFEEVQRRAAEKVAIEKDQEYRGKVNELEAAVVAGDKKTDQLQLSLQKATARAESGQKRVQELTQRANDLQAKYESSTAELTAQAVQIKESRDKIAAIEDVAREAQRQLSLQWGRGRMVAEKYANRRAELFRWIGVVVLILVVAGSTYIDKFVIPLLDAEYHTLANVALILVQVLLALSSVGLIVERFSSRPLEKLRKRLYIRRLEELGIPKEDEESLLG